MDDFQEKNPNRSLEFIPLHYATDYLRKPDEPDLELEFDLNSRTDESVFRKAEALDKISQYLYRYLYGKTSQADKTNHDE
ncbi:unnamed protein product [Adineta ricciae]|uniref:Uncharacterized protein n=1 Tax=Adineta ricciae TaxID=249248 RepID=A0A816HE42_ADIRI|nr:unnamed protein product [Adineta ricciae]